MDKEEYSNLKIKHFKLSSGDEILGLISAVDTKNGVIHIEYPVLMEQIGKNYVMMDYMPTSIKNIVAFNMRHVIAQSDVHETVKHEYIKYCIGITSDEIDDSDEHDLESDFMNKSIDKSKYH